MFAQMSTTATAVAVGSGVGHSVTQTMAGGFSGGHSGPAEPNVTHQEPYQQGAPQQQQQQACSQELRQLFQCTQKSDLKLCEAFNEALKKCLSATGLSLEDMLSTE